MKKLIIFLTALTLYGCSKHHLQYKHFSELTENGKGACVLYDEKEKVTWTCYK